MDSAVEYFKALADAVNTDHFESDVVRSTNTIPLEHMRIIGREIARVIFYDSIVVLQRMMGTREAPYRRVLTGFAAPVSDLSNYPRLPIPQFKNLLLAPVTAKAVESLLHTSVVAMRETIDSQSETV